MFFLTNSYISTAHLFHQRRALSHHPIHKSSNNKSSNNKSYNIRMEARMRSRESRRGTSVEKSILETNTPSQQQTSPTTLRRPQPTQLTPIARISTMLSPQEISPRSISTRHTMTCHLQRKQQTTNSLKTKTTARLPTLTTKPDLPTSPAKTPKKATLRIISTLKVI